MILPKHGRNYTAESHLLISPRPHGKVSQKPTNRTMTNERHTNETVTFNKMDVNANKTHSSKFHLWIFLLDF